MVDVAAGARRLGWAGGMCSLVIGYGPRPDREHRPGQAAAVNVSGADACQAATGGQHATARCGRTAAWRQRHRPGVVRRGAAPRSAGSAFGDLPKAAVASAHRADRRGSHGASRCTVTANPTGTAFSLRPCPATRNTCPDHQSPRGDRADQCVVKNYYLNCTPPRAKELRCGRRGWPGLGVMARSTFSRKCSPTWCRIARRSPIRPRCGTSWLSDRWPAGGLSWLPRNHRK